MRLLRLAVPIVLFVVALSGCENSPQVMAPEGPAATASFEPQSAPVVDYEYEELDVPANFGSGTSAYGISNSGYVVGNFQAPDGSLHGFVLRRNRFVDVTVPGAGIIEKGSLRDVNEAGTAVGVFVDPAGVNHGYSRTATGGITVLPDPAPVTFSLAANGINNAGTIVGHWTGAGPATHGFIRTGGQYTSYDYPGAASTHLNGINNHDQMVGTWSDSQHTSSFMRDGGNVIAIAVPGASVTYASSINDAGDIVGYWYNNPAQPHGFVRSPEGQYTTLDFPNASDTAAYGINDRSQIAGTYNDYSRGMLLSPVHGDVSVITFE